MFKAGLFWKVKLFSLKVLWWTLIIARHMPQNQQKVISILPHQFLNQMVVETFQLDGQYSGGTDNILRLKKKALGALI